MDVHILTRCPFFFLQHVREILSCMLWNLSVIYLTPLCHTSRKFSYLNVENLILLRTATTPCFGSLKCLDGGWEILQLAAKLRAFFFRKLVSNLKKTGLISQSNLYIGNLVVTLSEVDIQVSLLKLLYKVYALFFTWNP